MSLRTLHPELVEETRMRAYATFGPALVTALTRRLAECRGEKGLAEVERSLIKLIEDAEVSMPDVDAMREFAVEWVLLTLKDVREHPHVKRDLEEISQRRTEGRSENPRTLEEQLDAGLEDSFPASDPPSVVSTAISGRSKELTGTDDVLRRKKEARGDRQSD